MSSLRQVSSCKRSDSLLRFRRTLLHHFQLLPGTVNASSPHERFAATPHARRAPYRLVWQTRRAATAGRSAVGRTVANLDHLLARLRASYADFEVVSADFARMPLREQMATTFGADVFAGVHGAGLGHGLWMRPGSALIEVLLPQYVMGLFSNLARWIGANYLSWLHDSPKQRAGTCNCAPSSSD